MTIVSKETKVKRHSVIHTFILCSLFLASTALSASAQEEPSRYHEHQLELGYRAISTDDQSSPLRAREYDFLHSGMTGALDFTGGTTEGHYNFEGRYISEKDFDANAHVEIGPVFRLNLLSQSLFHNLDHIPYQPGAPGARNNASEDGGVTDTVHLTDANPADTYGIRVLENLAEVRLKPKSYPTHVTLRYWRLDRSGSQQMRWLDEGAGGTVAAGACGSCHMQSRSREIDTVTEEFYGAVDAHLGGIDLILEQTFRQFRDSEAVPRDTFGSHNLRNAGPYEHDEQPDARLLTTTIKAHTSLSGGFIAAGSVSFGKRENRSDLTDVRPIESETTYIKGAGDLTWIPTGKWTLNLRYRALDLENDSSATITADGMLIPFSGGVPRTDIDVRDNLDLRQYDYVTTVSFRPSTKLTLKGEGEYKEICRSNTGGPDSFSSFTFVNDVDIDPVWELPADETLQRYKLSFFSRPLAKKKLKLRGWYQYKHSNDPAYGSTVEDGHIAFLGAEWHPGMRWGLAINARAERNENRDRAIVVDDGLATQRTYLRDRDSDKQTVTAMVWANPTDSVSMGAHYGYLRSHIEQDLLFGTEEAGGFVLPSQETEYAQWVQTASANFSWRLLKSLTARAEGRYIRSHAAYDPKFLDTVFDYAGFLATATTEGLRELSKVDIRQFGGSAGLDWTPHKSWRTSLTYTFDKYDDLDAEIFDGKVQTYMASVAVNW